MQRILVARTNSRDRLSANEETGIGMDTRIAHLFELPQHIPTVAGWIYDEFWADNVRHSPESLAALLRQATRPDSMPLSLLALRNDQPVGAVNLVASDDDLRPHLTPWLAALFVLPEHRHQGIGSRLVAVLQRQAAQIGIHCLYLGTDSPRFYARLGATTYEKIGKDFCIMQLAGRP